MTIQNESESHVTARLSRWLRQSAMAMGTASALVGAGYLFAWLGGYLTHLGATVLIMKTNAALCLLASGVAIVLVIPPRLGSARRWTVRSLGFLVLTIGLLTLSENLIGWNLGIDQLLAEEAPGAIGNAFSNRMGLPASACFVLLGEALLLSAVRNRKWQHLAQGLALSVCLIALLGTIGSFYGALPLYKLAGLTAIAWPTAVSLLALGLGFLCAFPAEGLMTQVTADDPGGVSVRRMLPILLVPIGLGWLRLAIERWGLFDAATGTALMMIVFMVTLAVMIYAAGHKTSQAAAVERRQRDRVRESDEKLRESAAEMQTVNAELENSRRATINLLEDALDARRQAEEAAAGLRESEERLKIAILATELGTWDFSPVTGALNWDARCKELFGLPPESPVDYETFLAGLHPDDRDHVHKIVQGTFDPACGGKFGIDYRTVGLKDGGIQRWVHATGQSFFNDAGRAVRFTCTVQDITERKQAEQALHESEEKLSLALQSADMGVWRLDLSERKRHFDDQVCRCLGIDPARFNGTAEEFFAAVHPDDQDDAKAALDRTIKSGVPYVAEYRAVWPDGRIRHIAARGRLTRDAAGQPQWVDGLAWDITERKQIEDALRESELFYRRTLESIPGMVFTTRPDGYCDYQSQQWVDYTGIPMTEHVGDGWNRLLHPDDRPRAFAAWCAAVEGTAPYDLEYRVRRHDGVYEWFKVAGCPIRDGAGLIVRWFGIALNIDQLKQAEEALRESEERLALAADAGRIGMFYLNLESGDLQWTRQHEMIFGYEPTTTTTTTTTTHTYQDWSDRVHPDDLPMIEERMRQAMEEWVPFQIEYRLVWPDGSLHWVNVASKYFFDDSGRCTRLMGAITDITDRKQAEERLQASLHQKEVLLKEIHHRVKNNLQIISSLVNLQSDSIDNPDVRNLFQDVRDRVRSMALVHEKLYQSENLSNVQFDEYAGSLLNYLRQAYGKSVGAIGLIQELQPVTLSVEMAVPCGLILNELVTNAIKHAFRGRSTGEVRTALRCDPDGSIRLCVSDNGVGFPPELDWRKTGSLGLRLVQMLAGQLNATVEVNCGNGTEFQINFKLPDAAKWGEPEHG